MKTLRIFSLIVLFTTITASAQNSQQARPVRRTFSPEQYRQELEHFVAWDAGLTPGESFLLFPMLHEMMERQRKANDEARQLMMQCDENTTEEQYAYILDRCLTLEVNAKKIERDYYKKFHRVLSWRKVHKVRTAMFKFNMHALSRFAPPKTEQSQWYGQGNWPGRHQGNNNTRREENNHRRQSQSQ